MYDFSIYNELKKHLKVCRLTSSKDETICRCPYCGDSVKDKSHAHFYISNKPPFKYYCQRCNAKGVFNNNVAMKLKITDTSVLTYINKCNIEYKKQQNYKYTTDVQFLSNKRYNYSVNDLTDNYIDKLIYFRDRLGLDVNDDNYNEVLNRYKIILNLTEFLNNNKLSHLLSTRFKYESQKQILNDVDKRFIGFMALDNNFITFRNVYDDEPRYRNVRLILDDADSNKKIYTISNDIDLKEPIFNVYITEGVFDIIGVYNNVVPNNHSNTDIFVAANGKSHLLIFNTLLSMGIVNCNFHIYSDRDVNIDFYKKIKQNNRLLNLNGASIYYNELSKDTGTTKDKIKISKPIII